MEIKAPIEKILDKLMLWYEAFIEMLPNMAVALLLLILFFILAKVGRRIFIKLFEVSTDNKALENLFATIIYYAILGLGFFIILGVLKLQTAVTSLLAGVGVLGLALGFAFQDIAANFVSGIILAFRKPYDIGHIVEVNGIMGKVVRTNLRVLVVQTFQGQEIYVPNKDVLSSAICNYSILGQRRIDLAVGISYGDDLKKVEKLVRDAILGIEGVIREEDLIFDYYEFGSSSINFKIRFWIEYPNQPGFLQMQHKAIMVIKEVFDANDITIPFPIRTLDFGIKGGQTLSEMQIDLNK